MSMNRKLYWLMIFFLLFTPQVASVSQAVVVKNPSPHKLAAVSVQDQYKNEYLIQVGDLLAIKFFENQDLDEEVRVRPDGRISLQLIDELLVVGMKPSELREVIGEKYSHIFSNYKVSVIVREYQPQKVFVAGEVHAPDAIIMEGPLTVLQAISQAGGFTDHAKKTKVVVIRRNPTTDVQIFQVDLREAINGSDISQDIFLTPFDTVYVP